MTKYRAAELFPLFLIEVNEFPCQAAQQETLTIFVL